MRRGQADWNDSIQQFVKIKLEKPQILTELVEKQREYAERKMIEQKIQNLRNKYDLLVKGFKNEQSQLERNIQYKKQLQKEVSRINGDIIRMEVEFEKVNYQPILVGLNQEKEQQTRYSINSDSWGGKKQEELSNILAEHVSIRESITKQLSDLVFKRAELTEEFDRSADILQRKIRKSQVQEQAKLAQQQMRDLQLRLQKQQNKKKKLINKLEEVEKRTSQLRKSRDSYEVNIESSSRKLKAFWKECKKILMSEDGKNSKKYRQFLQKYRTFTPQEEAELKNQFSKSVNRNQGNSLDANVFPAMVQPKVEKYQQLIVQIMKKFSNKSYSADDFKEMQKNCKKIANNYVHLLEEDTNLDLEIDGLRENLKRKVKQIEMIKMQTAFKKKVN